MKIAAFQKSVLNAKRALRVSSIRNDLARCKQLGVDIVCFPECYLTGYLLDKSAIHRHAINLDSSQFQLILKSWAHFKMTIILGLIEKVGEHFFNTAVVIRNGTLVGSYRKTHPNKTYFEAGERFPIFEHEDLVFGINICNDANYPEAAAAIARQGATLIFYPLNNLLAKATAVKWRSKSPENLRNRALETGCWIISSDVAGSFEERVSYGCTQIVSPAGQVVASVCEFEEGFALYEILI